MPRSTLSDKQSGMISWVLQTLGVSEVPGESQIKSLMKAIQCACGNKTEQYEGALGHIYYMNDLSGIISQEMANPLVQPNLHFYPEDSGDHLSNAYQGRRWLYQLDPALLTPMIRQGGHDFYTFEPCLLSNKSVCIPIRFFF